MTETTPHTVEGESAILMGLISKALATYMGAARERDVSPDIGFAAITNALLQANAEVLIANAKDKRQRDIMLSDLQNRARRIVHYRKAIPHVSAGPVL